MISARRPTKIPALFAAVSLVLVVPSAGALPLIKPESLAAPSELTCLDMKEPLEFTSPVGLFGTPWTIRLERGPYVSEKVDGKGTFYRAPERGIRLAGNEPAIPGHGGTYDGGVYVPDDLSQPAKLYFYAGTGKGPDVPPTDADCSTAAYVKDPATSRISVVSLGTAGAIGGAAGGIAGRSLAKGSGLSYGQAAGVGAAGGLIAGVFIAWIVNRDAGKIYFPTQPKPTAEFLARLHALAENRVPLRELQPAAGDSPAGTAAETPAATPTSAPTATPAVTPAVDH